MFINKTSIVLLSLKALSKHLYYSFSCKPSMASLFHWLLEYTIYEQLVHNWFHFFASSLAFFISFASDFPHTRMKGPSELHFQIVMFMHKLSFISQCMCTLAYRTTYHLPRIAWVLDPSFQFELAQ